MADLAADGTTSATSTTTADMTLLAVASGDVAVLGDAVGDATRMWGTEAQSSGYAYDGSGLVQIVLAGSGSTLTRHPVRTVHVYLPAPTLVDGRPV